MENHTMDGFERRKERSKDNIRSAALELFSQFGVERVSVADIAKKAGVSQATIYNNFGSKEALAREFMTVVVDQLVDGVQAALASAQPFDEKIAAFIQFIAGAMSQDRPTTADRAVFASSLDLQNDPEIKKIRDSAQERMIGLLLGLIREGKEQGQVRADLSEEALTILFIAYMDIFTDFQLQNKFSRSPKLVEDLGALMIYGLRGA